MDANYDAALERLLHYGPEFGGGLSNHGPMALEALASLGRDDLYEPFVDRYVERLEPAANTDSIDGGWRTELAARLPELVAIGASQAGHGLLRVAHAIRAIEVSDNPIRRRELAAAMAYWRSGRALTGTETLTGTRSLDEIAARLPRLESEPQGFLTKPLLQALRRPDVIELLASIEPADDPLERFDQLALMAAEAMAVNRGLSAFGLLHGVTVSTMARRLVPYLDQHGVRILEARLVAFVAAAIVGLDRTNSSTDADGDECPSTTNDDHLLVDRAVHRLSAGLDDHDIKFADAASGLFDRTQSPIAVSALEARLQADF